MANRPSRPARSPIGSAPTRWAKPSRLEFCVVERPASWRSRSGSGRVRSPLVAGPRAVRERSEPAAAFAARLVIADPDLRAGIGAVLRGHPALGLAGLDEPVDVIVADRRGAAGPEGPPVLLISDGDEGAGTGGGRPS